MEDRARSTSPSPLRRRCVGVALPPATIPEAPLSLAGLEVWPLQRPDLPWRLTRDPWLILCSEVMLQQTPVARVGPRFAEFADRYPSATALATRPLSELLRWWAGLGYPRRAANLHRLATVVCRDHGGLIPDDLQELLRLPGVGPYTARAVLAIAFDAAVGVVDTNVGRVLARTHGRTLAATEAQVLADTLARGAGDGAATWNQKMLDLGATVCRPQPECGRCPLELVCRWRSTGCPDPDPSTRSAGVSRPQARYDGSDRHLRGRLLRELELRPWGEVELVQRLADGRWPHDQIARCLASLRSDGLITADGSGRVVLGARE